MENSNSNVESAATAEFKSRLAQYSLVLYSDTSDDESPTPPKSDNGGNSHDSECDSESSSSSSCKLESPISHDQIDEFIAKVPKVKEEKDNGESKCEPDLDALSSIQDLHITVPKDELKQIGHVFNIVAADRLVNIQSNAGVPTLNINALLFFENGKSFGKITDVFGKVENPLYSVQFRSMNDIANKGIIPKMPIYFAPNKKEYSHFVFVQQLRSTKGSDASWLDDEEPPPNLRDYSDDEQESEVKRQRKAKKRQENQAQVNHQQNFQANQVPYGYSQAPGTSTHPGYPLPNVGPNHPGYSQPNAGPTHLNSQMYFPQNYPPPPQNYPQQQSYPPPPPPQNYPQQQSYPPPPPQNYPQQQSYSPPLQQIYSPPPQPVYSPPPQPIYSPPPQPIYSPPPQPIYSPPPQPIYSPPPQPIYSPPPQPIYSPPPQQNFPPPLQQNYPPPLQQNYPPPQHQNYPPPQYQNYPPPPQYQNYPPPQYQNYPPPATTYFENGWVLAPIPCVQVQPSANYTNAVSTTVPRFPPASFTESKNHLP